MSQISLDWTQAKFRAAAFRSRAGAIVRRLAFIAKRSAASPSFVNVGAPGGPNRP